MLLRITRFATFVLLVLFGLLTRPADGQTFRGGISGLITDTSSAAVRNVEIKATNQATGQTHITVSSSAGEFQFQDLPLGSYIVSSIAPGFQPLQVTDVHVVAGVIYDLQLKVSVAQTSETVEVIANNVSLDTSISTQTTSIANDAVQSIPLNGRDFSHLIALAPGFGGYSAGGEYSVNGSRGNQQNWQIEGTDNNDLWNNLVAINQPGVSGIAGVVLPVDAIDEFTLQTQSSAETGRNPGATINLVIKSGTNQLHGSAYYYNRNEAFAAASPFLPAGDKKPEMRNDQFGFSLGGPIIKDKTFFFTGFEKQKFVIGTQGLATEPSIAYQSAAKQLLKTYGVAVNPVSTNLLAALWPAAALIGPASANNFFNPDAEFGYSYNGLIKLDHNFNTNNNLSLRWFGGQGNQAAPYGSKLKWYFEAAPIHTQNYSVIYNHNFSPRLTNQILLGVNYFAQAFHDLNTAFDPISLGLNTGVALPGAPNIEVSGFDSIGITPPEGRQDVTGHATDALSYSVGKHQLRFGGEFRKAQLDEFYHRHALGTFVFDGSQGPWETDASVDGNVKSLADFIAGYVQTSNITRGDPERLVYVNSFGLFFQDAFQVTRKLNLNYGLRWDYVSPLHNNKKNLSTFLPEAGIVFQGNQIDSLYPKDWKNVSPRVGFAYRPSVNRGVVVRGAFGFFYDTPYLNAFLDNRPGNGGPNGVEGNPGGTNPVQSISQIGYTIQEGVPLLNSTSQSIYNIFSVSQKFRTPYSYNYNLNIEKTLGANVLAQIGYVGNESRKQLSVNDINQAALSSAGANVAADVQQASRPYYLKYPNYGVINQIESNGTSNYNSLQAILRTSKWRGVSSQFSYTWSHTLDEITPYRGQLPQDSFNLKGNYGNSDYDTRHNATAYVVYDIPKYSRGPSWLSYGWQLNSLLSFHSGQPFAINTSSDSTGTGEGAQRPNLTGNATANISRKFSKDGVQWVNVAAFASPYNGTFGTLRRNQYAGPGYSDVDFSVLKKTRITGRLRAEFRVELFNVFNRINLAPPDGTLGDSSFGLSSDTIGDYNGAPGIGPGEPFNAQLALKLVF